jgi:hypothetical protein
MRTPGARALVFFLFAAVASTIAAGTAAASAATSPGWQVSVAVDTPAHDRGVDSVTMESISAPSADDVWAMGWLGSVRGDGPGSAIVEHWNGRGWQRIALPGMTTEYSYLISAVSSTDVWVFNSELKSGGKILQKSAWARWNGKSWAAGTLPMPALDTPGGDIDISAAAAVSPDDIWIGGTITSDFFPNTFTDTPFLASYNGATWHVYQFPGTATSITGISALGPADIWASAGGGQLSNEVNLLLHWNGRSWQPVRLPESLAGAGVDGPGFTGVIAESPHSAWVVGEMPQRAAPWNTVPGAAYWDGTRWTITTAPDVPYTLRSAVPDGSGGFWAAASYAVGGEDLNPPTEIWHYAHSRWSRASVPGLTGWDEVNALAEVPGTGSVWAAGDSLQPSAMPGLIFRYKG